MEQTDDSTTVRNALIVDNLAFVYSHVRDKWGGLKKSGHYQDIVSEGMLGLIRAAEKFDPNMGNVFITYAVYWIDQRIRLYISQANIPVTIPVNRIAIQKSAEKSYRKNGHKQDLALSEVLPEADRHSTEIIFSALLAKALPTNIYDSFPENSGSPLDLVLAEENRAQVLSAIQSLGDRSCKIVSEYYGINGTSKTLEEVGETLDVTRERIRQILDLTRGKLKKILKRHFSEKSPQFDFLPQMERGASWSAERLKDSAHQYFDTPIHGWISNCPCCGDAVWNSRQETVLCQNCGYDSDATRTCYKCDERVLIGFPCYCDYLPSREEASFGWNIRKILAFHSPCGLERLADELNRLGFSYYQSELLTRLQRDRTVIKGMDDNYYLRETAPSAILELERIGKRLEDIEGSFHSKSEALDLRLRNYRRNSDLVALARKEFLALEQDYLFEKERLIARWEILASEMNRPYQKQWENPAGVENG